MNLPTKEALKSGARNVTFFVIAALITSLLNAVPGWNLGIWGQVLTLALTLAQHMIDKYIHNDASNDMNGLLPF